MGELFRRLEQPVREAVGKAAKHCDLIGRGIVDLPKDDADVIGMRDRDAVALKARGCKSIGTPLASTSLARGPDILTTARASD